MKKIKQYKWYISAGYAVTKGINPNSGIDISNVIFDDYDSMFDHINHNRLDNRKCNLRKTTAQKNAMNMGKKNANTSGVTGVTSKKVKEGIKWYAVITYKYKPIWLGCYDTFEEAVTARILGESEYFKEYSPNYNIDTNSIIIEFLDKDDNQFKIIETDLNKNILRKEIIIQEAV